MNFNISKLVVLLCLLINMYSTSFATIILVPDEYATIQLAINAAINRDTVLAAPGTYTENLNFRGKNIVVTSRYYNSENLLPEKILLMQNYPNPFNPTTTIHFALPIPALVSLKVYDILGREMTTLLNNKQMQAGEHEIEFDAGNVSSGIYFYALSVGDFVERKKMIVQK